MRKLRKISIGYKLEDRGVVNRIKLENSFAVNRLRNIREKNQKRKRENQNKKTRRRTLL